MVEGYQRGYMLDPNGGMEETTAEHYAAKIARWNPTWTVELYPDGLGRACIYVSWGSGKARGGWWIFDESQAEQCLT